MHHISALLLLCLLAFSAPALALSDWEQDRLRDQIIALEVEAQGRLGIMALYTGSNNTFTHNADQRFPLASTFKAILTAAVLHRSQTEKGLLDQELVVPEKLVAHSPVTTAHKGKPMKVRDLCAAAMEISDNTATNMLLDLLGGPSALRLFTKSLGDKVFRLDRREPELNSALPGDKRDTSSPRSMVELLQKLLLPPEGIQGTLHEEQRALLETWLRNCQTGPQRIMAALPAGWSMGHKTGSGDYGTSNDVAIVWPEGGAPIILAIYLTQTEASAAMRDDIIRQAAQLLLKAQF